MRWEEFQCGPGQQDSLNQGPAGSHSHEACYWGTRKIPVCPRSHGLLGPPGPISIQDTVVSAAAQQPPPGPWDPKGEQVAHTFPRTASDSPERFRNSAASLAPMRPVELGSTCRRAHGGQPGRGTQGQGHPAAYLLVVGFIQRIPGGYL